MKLTELLARTSLKAIGRQLGLEVRMVHGHLQIRELMPRPLWALRLSSKSCFCRAVVQTGMLTGLRKKLRKLGSPPNVHSYMPNEVELIVKALGQPYGKKY